MNTPLEEKITAIATETNTRLDTLLSTMLKMCEVLKSMNETWMDIGNALNPVLIDDTTTKIEYPEGNMDVTTGQMVEKKLKVKHDENDDDSAD